MKLTREQKKIVKAEREKLIVDMSNPSITKEDWETANSKLQVYSDMLKRHWKITPDTILVVGGNLAGILLILNFEKMDIVRSKAMSFVLKGRL
jgi:hypothetical protein